MKGCIVERNGSLRLKVSLGKNSQTGKYDAYYETFHGSMPDAQKRLRSILTDHDKGIFVKPGKSTMAEYLNSWLLDYIKPNLSPRTYELYNYTCQKHIIPALGNLSLVELKPTHLQHLYSLKQTSGLSNRTVQLIHITIHKSLKNAVKIGLLTRNISEVVDTPKTQPREMRLMTEENIKVFLDEARKGEYYALFFTLLFTGMRRGEALSLRWSDIDLLGCQLSINRTIQVIGNKITFKTPKTASSRRQIALSPNTCIVLRLHKEKQNAIRQSLNLPQINDSDLVFCHYEGTPYLPNSITHNWIKTTKLCGLGGVRLHDARHTHASLMLKNGTSPKVIQERLGHSTFAITMNLYAHVSPGMQKEAVCKFDDIVMQKNATS